MGLTVYKPPGKPKRIWERAVLLWLGCCVLMFTDSALGVSIGHLLRTGVWLWWVS